MSRLGPDFEHKIWQPLRRVVIEPVFSMKTGSNAEYFYISSIIVSEGLTVTLGSKAAKAICLFFFFFFNPLFTQKEKN